MTNSLRFLYCTQGYTHYHEEAYSDFETWQTEQCGLTDAVKDVKKLLDPGGGLTAQLVSVQLRACWSMSLSGHTCEVHARDDVLFNAFGKHRSWHWWITLEGYGLRGVGHEIS